MRKILLGAVLFGATTFAATGCIFVSGDGDGDGDGDGTGDILLSWTTDPGCPLGGDTAQLTAAPTNGGQSFINLFNCVDGLGRIDDLPAGSYDVFINITSDDEATLFAQSFSEPDVLVVGGTETVVDAFTILTEDAFFGFDWEISDGGVLVPDCIDLPDINTGVANDCNQTGCALSGPNFLCDSPSGVCFGPGEVGILATVVSNSEIAAQEFSCTPTGSAQAGPFPLGGYSSVIFSIVSEIGTPMLDTAPIPTAELLIGNEIDQLGTALFDVTVP